MSADSAPPPPGDQFLVYQTQDGKMKIDVRFEGETVWLTQQHMAELFQTTQQNISLHLQNIYAEGELQIEATHKESLSVRQEGARSVRRRVDFYNLEKVFSDNELQENSVIQNFRITAAVEQEPGRANRPGEPTSRRRRTTSTQSSRTYPSR